MNRLLVIQSSPVTDNSHTRQLIGRFVDAARRTQPQLEIVERDLGRNPPPHIDEVMIGSYYTAPAERNGAQQQSIALSEELVDELLAADTLVIGAPMHNFSVTSGLKTWIDHVARVGRTFQYGANGPEGLATGKKAYVLTASGGDYRPGSAAESYNHLDPYLRTVLGFIGITDVTFVNAVSVASGDEGRLNAEAQIEALFG
ncbi:FMN-dependent NADH-azoreductase [Motiliproteus sediminis]|uniref:FMN-dependent NADH-azoreductase n=1 Tax=Motiliproteus sediminis TaxID=1468178 RepID=UPI001AF017D9|nr:FMN-dependent NADH-azoreductase [Motiliproteus sediminis]